METALAILTGLFFATSIYLMLSRHIIRILLGVAILGNAVTQKLWDRVLELLCNAAKLA